MGQTDVAANAQSARFAGAACYIAVMVMLILAFKKGGALTVLNPIYATTFIWAAELVLDFWGTPVNVTGMALLVAVIYLMG